MLKLQKKRKKRSRNLRLGLAVGCRFFGLNRKPDLNREDRTENKPTRFGGRFQLLVFFGLGSVSGQKPKKQEKPKEDRNLLFLIKLHGTIPEFIGELPELEVLQLWENNFTGSIPQATIGNFSNVQKLLLDGNRFTGSIPSQIGNLKLLSKIDFSHNRFSGQITPEISQCKLLTFVDLSRNSLSGEIPTEITEMRIFNYLNVSRNKLTGNIPPSISSVQI
ncbi:Leucine-rich repeat receptor-like serine/threonine-protein kinase BAM1 [Linum perenne]